MFSQKEKEELKASYQRELNTFDWNKWENRLRTVYDNVNWDKVNNQLSTAINQIKISKKSYQQRNNYRKNYNSATALSV